jgi:hypothetical protein
MANELTSQYTDFLRQIFLFSSLNDEQIDSLAQLLEGVEYTENQVIYEEGEAGDYFYIVYRGRVKMTMPDLIEEKLLGIYGPGEYFGEQSLLLDRPHPATAIAIEPAYLLQIHRDVFVELMREHSGFRDNLLAVIKSRKLSGQAKFEWLGADEVIYLLARKHEYFFYRSLILPIMLGLTAIPLFIFGVGSGSPFFRIILLASSAIFIAGAVLWAIWNHLDWGNDYYIVTNQRVLWIERVIGLYNSRREAPLTAILTVNVSSSQLGRLLNFGDVDVRTFTGSILMRNMARPNLFASFVKGHQDIAQQHLKEEELKSIRAILRRTLSSPTGETVPIIQKPVTRFPERPLQAKDGGWKQKFETFFKVRYEKSGVVTYRKHWLVLVKKIASPTLAIFLLSLFSIYLIWQLISGNSFLLSIQVWSLLLFPSFGLAFLWWGYRYLDWSNDIYRLTPDQILDIEKKPLGNEDKKTASLDSILSIEHARNGIIQLLFNYGDVIINVGQTQFIFRGVYNPDQVHQDVADYMEARLQKKRANEAKIEQERMANWLKTYHEQTGNLNEHKNEPGDENISG